MPPAQFATTAPEPDKGQLATFTRTIFKHATPGGNVSLRAFGGDGGKAKIIRVFEIEPGLMSIINGAVHAARDAAAGGWVFAPPIATFKDERNAAERNLAEGLTITVECDEHPRTALAKLSALIGPPTLVVESGGRWTDPETGEVQNKLHLHWVLSTPARDAESLTRLKRARGFATDIVGADPSCVPIVHPLRWPGSWHMKDPANPRLCRIIGDIGSEIELDAVYDVLRGAASPEAVAEIEKTRHVGEAKANPAKPSNAFQELTAWASSRSQLVDINELTELMAFVPNKFPLKDRWKEWDNVGLRLYTSSGGSEAGFALFDAFSKKDPDAYDAAFTRQCWEGFKHCPPDRTGPAKLFSAAMANGWKTAPTHAPSPFTDIDEARRKIALAIYNFLHPNAFLEFVPGWSPPLASAIRCETGVGKTEAAIIAIAKYVGDLVSSVSHRVSKAGTPFTVTRQRARRVGFGVATHKLGGEIEQRFANHGVDAATYRGRNAIDPEGDGAQKMCMALDKVKNAIEARQDVEKTCCASGNRVCEFYDRCGYQRQKEKLRNATVAIFASDVIFHSQPVIGNLDALFLDEEFSLKQIANAIEIPLKDLKRDGDKELDELAETLMLQNEDGALTSKTAEFLVGGLNKLRVRLLNEKPTLEFYPDMSAAEMSIYARRNRKLIKRATLYRNVADVLSDMEAMFTKNVAVSGRLFLGTGTDNDHKARVLHWLGVRKITKQFDVPTFAMDATLPPVNILRLTHPTIRQIADIRVAMPPSARVVQVIGAPTSKNKLISGKHVEKHQQEIVRYIIKRWLECGRGKTLVICQQEFEEKVLTDELPEGLAILHFNALSGVDAFGDVRLLIVIGRTLPPSASIEEMAGTLTGAMPECCVVDGDDDDDADDGDDAKAPLRYKRVRKGIRLRDGTGRAVRVNQHPDELCEALRWQACEAQLVQAIGRARGINRDASSPLDIDMLFDEVLPIEVDDDPNWTRPSLFFATARDGVMLMSPTDMQKIWPDVWENLRAAERTAADDIPELPGFEQIQYQLKGRAQKWRDAWFDRSVISDPVGWLSERLGGVNVRAKP